jgi:hypothetical protein
VAPARGRRRAAPGRESATSATRTSGKTPVPGARGRTKIRQAALRAACDRT